MSRYLRNRLYNCKNDSQGDHRKVLCVCSAGLLRSPTAALVLSQAPFNFNTRAAGLTPEFALVPVDEVLLTWADEIVCMEPKQAAQLDLWVNEVFEGKASKPKIKCLNIADSFRYRDAVLMKMIADEYTALSGTAL